MKKIKTRNLGFLLLGAAAGIVITLLLVVIGMRTLMITEHDSPLGFDETVAGLERSIKENGWVVAGSRDLNKSMKKNGVDFGPKVRLIELCKPPYAAEVLEDDRHLACLMPCTIAVYQGEDGAVKISKMNTGLMGKVFGGTVSRVMGGSVSSEEEKILSAVLEGK